MIDINNSYDYKDYIIVDNQQDGLWDIYESDTGKYVGHFSTSSDAEEYIDEHPYIPDEEEEEDTTRYVVFKVWKNYYTHQYIYSFYKGGAPSNNVRYSEDSIVRGSQKDVPTWTEDEAKKHTDRLNKISKENNYKPTWQYKEVWW